MTEKRVVTLNILLDGTGNNRRVDKAKGKESNVARIGDTLEADYSFDVSKGLRDNPAFASTLSEVSGDTLGNRRALAEFIKNDTSSSTINAYYEGIGSNENDSVVTQKIQGGTGSGFEERVKYFAKMIKEIHDADPDAEIKLNVVGFSRGAAEAKALLNELASDDHSHILVNKVVLFDTVVAKDNPMSTAHSDVDLDFPKELIPNPENVLELNSSNESRSSFPLTPYQQEGVLTRWFPGVHAQIGGGYSNDILAYAGYAAALNHLSKNTSTSAPLELRQLSLEQTVLIAVSHIILQNPYMTRAFLIDSRVMVDSATSTEDNTYYGEESQEGFFDRATDPRRVIDENQVNDDSEILSFAKDVLGGIGSIFLGPRPEKVHQGGENLVRNSESIENIEARITQLRDSLVMPDNGAALSPKMISLLDDLLEITRDIGKDFTGDDEFVNLRLGGEKIAAAFSAMREKMENTEGLSAREINVLDRVFTIGDKKAEQLATHGEREEHELRNSDFSEMFITDIDEHISEEQNETYISYQKALYDFSQSLKDGDLLDLADTGVSLLKSIEKQMETHDPKNLENIRNGFSDEENTGMFNEIQEDMLDVLSSALSFGNVIDTGDELRIIHSGLGLVQAIDSYCNTKALKDQDDNTTPDTAGLTNHQAANVGKLLAALNFSMAIETGDDLGTAIAGANLLASLTEHAEVLGKVTSALSFVQDITSLDDVFERGDFGEIAYTLTNTVYHGIETYNTVMSLAGASGSLVNNFNMLGIGTAIGVGLGVQEMLDGDVEKGAVDAGTAIASYYLMTAFPVWGTVAAAALSIASALLNGDDTPRGHAVFSIENGVVDFSVGGDSEMANQTTEIAQTIRNAMQEYLDTGGRIELGGEKMPELSLEQGDVPCVSYGSVDGGGIHVELDYDNLYYGTRGILIARDRGADIANAISQSQTDGVIDFARVDAILAGLGYVKNGINYSWGEHKQLNLDTVGTSTRAGGGNVEGPEDAIIRARDGDSSVLQLRTEQLPQQVVGRVIRNIDLGTNLLGTGSGLFAAALMAIGLDDAEAAEPLSLQASTVLPLDALTAEVYRFEQWLPTASSADQDNTAGLLTESSLRGDSNAAELAAFVNGEWSDLSFCPVVSAAPGIKIVEQIDVERSIDFANESAVNPHIPQTISVKELVEATASENNDTWVIGQKDVSQSLQDVPATVVQPKDTALPTPPPEIERGTVFHTVEDGSLRFVTDQLISENGTVARAAEAEQFVRFGDSQHGTLSADDNGDYRFTPDQDFTGYASFRYFVRNRKGEELEKEAAVYVEAQNHAPIVMDDAFSVQQGGVIFLDQLLENDSDADGDELTLLRFSTVDHGRFTTIDGRPAYVADRDFYGTEDFTYWVQENRIGDDVWPVAGHAVVHCTYDSTGDDRFSVVEEQDLSVDIGLLLANDIDQRGDRVSFDALGQAVNGEVRVEGNTIIFSPTTDYFGDEAGFFYSVIDAENVVSKGWVTVSVSGVNDAPEADRTLLETAANHSLVFDQETLSKLFHDADNDDLIVKEIVTSAGEISKDDSGNYILTPDRDFDGNIEVALVVADGSGEKVSSTVMLHVAPMDDPETVDSQTPLSPPAPLPHENDSTIPPTRYSVVTMEDSAVSVDISAVMAATGEADTFAGIKESAHGSVKIEGEKVIFTPEADYAGDRAGFVYQVKNAAGELEEGWLEVQITDVPDSMEIVGDQIFLSEDQPLVFDEQTVASLLSEADGTGITLQTLKTDSTHGEIRNEQGLFSFIPEENWYGQVRLDYTAIAGDGEEIAGQLDASFFPENDLPEADMYIDTSGVEDQEVLVSVEDLMAGARDVEDGSNLRFGGVNSVVNGNAWIDSENILHLQPHENFYGTAALSYRLYDSEGGVGLGYGRFDFSEVNDAPIAENTRVTAWSNGSYQNIYDGRQLLKNDFDIDGDPLQIISVGQAQHGTVSLDANGMIHYSSSQADWVGTDSFTYRISDGRGGEAEAVVNVDVKLNSSPVLSSEMLEYQEDNILILDQSALLANDTDAEGDPLRITEVGNSQHCQVSLLDDGSIQIIPESNYNKLYYEKHGDASFEYKVSDGISASVSSVAVLDIQPVNDLPVIQDIVFTGAYEDNGYQFTINQLTSGCTDVEMASDVETDFLRFQGITDVQHGEIVFQDNGTYLYTPDENFYGTETLFYSVADGSGVSVTGQAMIEVAAVNDHPVVQYDRNSRPAEDSIWNNIDIRQLLANDFDVDGDILSAQNFHITNGRGNLAVNGHTLSVKPGLKEDYMEIEYDVVDGHGGSSVSKLIIDNIHEHNFAPTFSGLYSIDWKNQHSNTVWFNFHAEDKNGGNTWGDPGEIASIEASHLSGGDIYHQIVNPFTFKLKIPSRVVYDDPDHHSSGAPHTIVLTPPSLILTVADQQGASSSLLVDFDKILKQHGRSDGTFVYSPVIVDLDNDGIELVDISAGVRFDWNGDGEAEQTGWTSGDDAFLVYDYDGDGLVTQADEISLLGYREGATTDLEGLQAFDTNGDGAFSADDEAWDSFALWQDKNSDGVTDEGELLSIGESELSSIDLGSDKELDEVGNNILFGTTTATTENGETLNVGDVALLGEKLELKEVSPENMGDNEEQTETVAESTVSEEEDASSEAEDSLAVSQDLAVEGIDSTDMLSSTQSQDLPFDESSLNNQVDQLISDMAANISSDQSLTDEPVPAVVIIADDYQNDTNDIDENSLTVMG